MNVDTTIETIRNTTYAIRELAMSDHFQELKQTNYADYKQQLTDIVPSFASSYPTLFELVIDGVDISPIEIIFKGHSDFAHGHINNEQMDEQIGKKMCDVIFDDTLMEQMIDKGKNNKRKTKKSKK